MKNKKIFKGGKRVEYSSKRRLQNNHACKSNYLESSPDLGIELRVKEIIVRVE
jgi:hypothetical protein